MSTALPPPVARGSGLGLRGQIALALLTGLGLSVVLVGIAADRLATRTLEVERERAATLGARAAAAMIRNSDAPPFVIDAAESALMRPDAIIGLEVLRDGQLVERRGAALGLWADAPLADGGSVRAYVASVGAQSDAPFVRLLVLYAAITAAAILLLSYVLLTYLIVRPVEELTRAAARLGTAQDAPTRARARGAAEVQALALTFNRMQDELRLERAALTLRLAELEETTAELRSAQDSLLRSEKLASVGRLAAGVAHEIGNPLSAILGLVGLMREGGLAPDEEQDFLARIQRETERIHRIIRELLDFARQEPEADEEEDSADLEAVIERATHLVTPQKDLRRVSIERRVPEGLPRVRGSEDRLGQVLLNLLLNAADAIDGEGAISIEAALDDSSSPPFVTLSVTDTGPGVPAAVRDSLFEPFVTTKPAGSGTGLGLAVCHTLVTRLGGTIEVLDATGGGARFQIRLPVAR